MPNTIIDMFGCSARHVDVRHWQSGFPTKFTDLPGHGIDLVVLAARRLQPDAEDIAHLRERCPQLGVIQVPFDDTEDPAALPEIVRKAREVAHRVVERLAEGKRVLITCEAGRNRSGLISALVLMERHGWSGKDAAARVRSVRDDALTNTSFAAYLDSLPAT